VLTELLTAGRRFQLALPGVQEMTLTAANCVTWEPDERTKRRFVLEMAGASHVEHEDATRSLATLLEA